MSEAYSCLIRRFCYFPSFHNISFIFFDTLPWSVISISYTIFFIFFVSRHHQHFILFLSIWIYSSSVDYYCPLCGFYGE
ncbi:hypothetical protein BGX38DRAFT_1152690 [Terfezia claveryi]|nr:hypothetical protein BGX38DRAFT_1152690 [Terfezia claveryi]